MPIISRKWQLTNEDAAVCVEAKRFQHQGGIACRHTLILHHMLYTAVSHFLSHEG